MMDFLTERRYKALYAVYLATEPGGTGRRTRDIYDNHATYGQTTLLASFEKAVGVIHELADEGLVEPVEDTNDGRGYRYRVTERGAAVVRRYGDPGTLD